MHVSCFGEPCPTLSLSIDQPPHTHLAEPEVPDLVVDLVDVGREVAELGEGRPEDRHRRLGHRVPSPPSLSASPSTRPLVPAGCARAPCPLRCAALR